LKKHDTSINLGVVPLGSRELRSAGPSRGVLRAPLPDGRIDGLRVLPPAQLSAFVHHFWSVRWALRTPFKAEALTHPAAQIVFEDTAGTRRVEIAGVRTGRLAIRRAGEGHAFGITFRPAMFQPLLRAPMTSLTDRVVPAAHVFGPQAVAWGREIHAAPALEAKIAIAGAFLAPLLVASRPRVERFRDLVEGMGADRSVLRVEDASEAVGLDVRALQRCFRRYVGVSPKWVIQRYRLHEASEQLKARRPPALAALAASLGYADQAHFARDFKRVVGQTPRSFARTWAGDSRRTRTG
jgi:AraC-like DNA-binding protein